MFFFSRRPWPLVRPASTREPTPNLLRKTAASVTLQAVQSSGNATRPQHANLRRPHGCDGVAKRKTASGVPTSTHTLHQGFGFVISNTALGMRPVLYDEGVGSRYTGKERDAESGNDYFGARYYASNVGRWLSPDWSASEDPVPYANLSNPQSLNLYAYIQNNPLYAVDSDGHDGCAAEGMPIDCGEVNSEAFTQCPDNQCTGVSRVWYSPSGGKYDGDQAG